MPLGRALGLFHMKLLLQSIATLLIFISSLSHAEKFPRGIPSVIEGEAVFATIIDYPDLKTSHNDLNKDDLAEIEGYFVVNQKRITNNIKVSEAVVPLQNVASEDGHLGLCFNPRHYISYQSAYGKVSLTICYECSRVLVNIEGWYKTLSLNQESAEDLNAFYESINLTIPRTYQEKPNKLKNEHASDAGSDAA